MYSCELQFSYLLFPRSAIENMDGVLSGCLAGNGTFILFFFYVEDIRSISIRHYRQVAGAADGVDGISFDVEIKLTVTQQQRTRSAAVPLVSPIGIQNIQGTHQRRVPCSKINEGR